MMSSTCSTGTQLRFVDMMGLEIFFDTLQYTLVLRNWHNAASNVTFPITLVKGIH
jgi:hypothetical protein